MKIFPTQYSLLSAPAIKEALEIQYGFNEMNCRLLIHNVSDTYILEGSISKYIFKIYRDAHRSLEEIKGEVELLNILFEQGAKVSFPIADLKGEFIQSFNAAEGIRYGVLFSFAEGVVNNYMTDEQLVNVGHEMAVIHAVTSKIELAHKRKEFTIDSLLIQPLKIIKPSFKELEEEYNYLENASAQIIRKIEELDLSSFGYGYCQYDFLPKNFHFQENGAVTFFDFDFAGKGCFVNDLASFYAHYFILIKYDKIDQTEADRAFGIFLDSYRKTKALSDAEIAAIPYFGFAWWMFYFAFHYEHFDDWSNFFYGPRFIKERVGWIKDWMEWYVDPNKDSTRLT